MDLIKWNVGYVSNFFNLQVSYYYFEKYVCKNIGVSNIKKTLLPGIQSNDNVIPISPT